MKEVEERCPGAKIYTFVANLPDENHNIRKELRRLYSEGPEGLSERAKDDGAFCGIFQEVFMKQAGDNNRLKSEGMIRADEAFEEAFHRLERLFASRYDDKSLLYRGLKEYLQGGR